MDTQIDTFFEKTPLSKNLLTRGQISPRGQASPLTFTNVSVAVDFTKSTPFLIQTLGVAWTESYLTERFLELQTM